MIGELARELGAVGIRGRRRERILAEFADHLACNPGAELGDPRALAVQFADELASDSARHNAFATFGALATVALAVGIPQLTLPTVPDITGGRSTFLVVAAGLALFVGGQIAFVAGCLAALRALRFSGPDDVAVVRRRVGVALAAGAATAAGSALYAVNFWNDVPGWWGLLAVAGAGGAALPVAATAWAFARAGRLAVSRTAPMGLHADLGRLAQPLLIGAAAALAMFAATAVLERDVLEGLLRASFEALAFAVCFVALRRPLALAA